MKENRGSWYLLTGLVLGLGLALLYAWLVQPLTFRGTNPASLRPEFKDRYRVMIAAAYRADGDLFRAKARLELLNDPDLYGGLAEQAQRSLADGSSPEEAQALGMLALALGQENAPAGATSQAGLGILPSSEITPAMAITITSTPFITITIPIVQSPGEESSLTPISTANPTSTATLPPPASPTISPTSQVAPILQPTSTPGALFVLDSRELICEQVLAEPLIQVQTFDAMGQPVPGVEVIVTWEGGEERFFTGLKPELGLGYADFNPSPGITYTLRLAEGGQPISNLAAATCPNANSETPWGAWALTFIQP